MACHWAGRDHQDLLGRQTELHLRPQHAVPDDGNRAIITRLEDLWEKYLSVSPSGLVVEELDAGEARRGISAGQAGMLDALMDAYLATGSTTLLADAQGLAVAILAQNPAEEMRDATARPFFRLAEATNGAIGRLEVNLGSEGGGVRVRTLAGIQIFPVSGPQPPPWTPAHSTVIYLPQGTYQVDLTPVGRPTRAVTLAVSSAGAKIDYLAGSPATSFVTGIVMQDNNDNGVWDTGDTTPSNGSRVYVDSNNSGGFDIGEPSQILGSTGSYTLPVAVAPLTVRVELPSGMRRWTTPSTLVVNGSPGHAITFHTTGLSVTPGAFGWTTKRRISGIVFNDANADSVKNGSERNLTESIVYLDTNNNGVKNLGEPFAATNTSGSYSIGNLSVGGRLRVVRRSAVPTVTTPVGGSQSVVFSSPGHHVTGRNFGCFGPG